jgi:hypothetical protein
VTFPTFTIEFSPGTGPYDTASWVDISNRVHSASWKWGRVNELQQFDPGEATLRLYNHDRLFDPEYTAGTYFGDLNPRVPFRITSPGKTHFYGFVRDGWEQVYEAPENAWCDVTLSDLLDVIAKEVLPISAYQGEVLADSPKAYWRLDEESGVSMGDSSGNGNNGLYSNPTLGEDPLIVDAAGHSITCAHVGDSRGEFRGATLPTGPPCTLEAWVKLERDLAAAHSIMVVQRDSAFGSGLILQIATSAGGSPNGELQIDFFGLGTSYVARGNTRVDDGFTHHVACTMSSVTAANIKLYVDGVEQTKTTVSGTNGGNWTGHLWWTVGNTTDNGQGDFGLGGQIDEPAVYNTALSAARILAHYEAGATAFDGESTGDRIDRVLDIAGVPAGMRDIATGDTFMGPANYGGSRVGDYLSKVVESEQGYLWVDHADSGKIKFRGRYSRFTEARSTSSQATFSDQTSATLRYERDGLDVEPNGMRSVINRVEVGWQGGTEIVASTTSPYGPEIRTIRTEASTPTAAKSAGNWLIARFQDPQTRVRGLEINPGAASALQTTALDLRVGDRVTVVRQPQSVGSATTNVLIVEGVKHRLTNGVRWEASYMFSDADTSQVWIWGTSTWGETTTWG